MRRIEHTARTKGVLQNVNADITGIIYERRGENLYDEEEADEQEIERDRDEAIFEREIGKGIPKPDKDN